VLHLKKYFFAPVLLLSFIYTGDYDQINNDPIDHAHNSAITNDTIVFIAHRGISRYYPENSLPAVQASTRYGFHGVEVDISRATDSLVVFHD
jgi:hypothetical protein